MVLFSIERLSAQAFSNSKLTWRSMWKYSSPVQIPVSEPTFFFESWRSHTCGGKDTSPNSPLLLGMTLAAHMSPAVSPLLWLWKANTIGARETCAAPRDISMAVKHPGRSAQPLTDLWVRACCYLLVPCSAEGRGPQPPQAPGSPQNADKALQGCPPPQVRSTQITKSDFL